MDEIIIMVGMVAGVMGLVLLYASMLVIALVALWVSIIDREYGTLVISLIVSLLLIAFGLATVFTLQSVFDDGRFGGDRGYIEAAQILQTEGKAQDLIIADLWGDDLFLTQTALLNYCKGLCPPRLNFIREQFIDKNPDWRKNLAELIAGRTSVWVVLDNVPEHLPGRVVEQGMDELGYWMRSFWTGPNVRIVQYSTEPGQALWSETPKAIWENSVQLDQFTLKSTAPIGIRTGDILQVELGWQSLLPITENLSLSLQLLDASNQVRSQVDRALSNGLPFTSDWQVNTAYQDRLALQLPKDLPEGEYRLLLILYDPYTQKRWQLASGKDYYLLDTLLIVSS